MLDLKAKLLAAGVVTADQVKKVEEDEERRKDHVRQRRQQQEQQQHQRQPQQDRADRAPRSHGDPRDDRRGDGQPRGPRGPRRDDQRQVQVQAQRPPNPAVPAEPGRDPRQARDQRSWKERKAQDNLERRAKREHQWELSLRWRGRVDELKAAGKSEQYEAMRGWVMKLRLDNSQLTDDAVRFHYPLHDGTIAHLTVEPAVQQALAGGSAGVVAFIGYNGREHAAVPADVARDMHTLQPGWLRHLVGITDQPDWVAIVPEQVDDKAVKAPELDDNASADATGTPAGADQ
jgi:hypothetical protein